MSEAKPEETLAELLKGCRSSNRKQVTVRRDDLSHAIGKGQAEKLMKEKGAGTSTEWVKFSRPALIEALEAAEKSTPSGPTPRPAA